MSWCLGVSVSHSVSVLECWFLGVSDCQYVGVCRCVGLSVCQCVSAFLCVSVSVSGVLPMQVRAQGCCAVRLPWLAPCVVCARKLRA